MVDGWYWRKTLLLPAGCERSRVIAFRHAVPCTATLEQSIIALFIINLIVVLRAGTAMGVSPNMSVVSCRTELEER